MSRLDRLLNLHHAAPSDADVLYMIAQEHAKAGDHAEAVRWFERCVGADPAYHYAYYHMARSQEACSDKEGSRTTLRTGLERAKADGHAKAAEEIRDLLATLSH